MAELIPIDKIDPNPEQPRKIFDDDELSTLAESIKDHGLIQPISLEARPDGRFWLIDGERRWRAVQLLKRATIKAHVEPLDGATSQDRLQRAMVANIHRADMNVIEEGDAFLRLREEFKMSYVEISHMIGKQEQAGYAYICNRIAWAKMESDIRELVARGKLPIHDKVVRALNSLPDAKTRIELAKKFSKNKASINGIERSCQWYAGRDRGEVPADIPGMRFAALRDKGGRPKDSPTWNALCQVGKAPAWSVVTDAARQTCRACTLFDMASADTCQECGVVEMLRILMELR